LELSLQAGTASVQNVSLNVEVKIKLYLLINRFSVHRWATRRSWHYSGHSRIRR
jgi:hypothetical protein